MNISSKSADVDFFKVIHGDHNPYDGLDESLFPDRPHGSSFYTTGIDQLFAKCQPKTFLEVGVWYGGSAIDLAKYLKKNGQKAQIVCVDTFLGDVHLKHNHFNEFYPKFGRPTIYETFLANVIRADVQDYIVPFPFTSTDSARFFKKLGITFDLSYIDASHNEAECYLDIAFHWLNVPDGGVIYGDDLTWPGVMASVRKFTDENGLNWEFDKDHSKWIIHKFSAQNFPNQ